MRKFLLALIFILPFTSDLFAQGFNSIHTPDGQYVIAVGNGGKIFRSSNSGNTWASYTINPSVDYKSVYSFNDDVWIAGSNGNVYTTSKVTSPLISHNVGASVILNSIYFLNSNTGFVCGDNGSVYKTVNGGANWTASNSGISSAQLNSISFKDENNGVVVGNNGSVYTTANGGNTWTSVPSGTTKNLLKAKFFNNGFTVVGEYGTILMMPDGGSISSVNTRTWSDIRGITGSSMSDVTVCGGGGFIRNNKNGSSNFFNFEANPMMANLVDIFYYNSTTGFAVSSLNTVIIRTTNGGQSWSLPSGSNVSFNWVSKTPNGSGIGNNLCQHPNNRDAMFVVYGTKVYRSGDKGETWTQLTGSSLSTGRAHSFYVSPLDTNIWVAAVDNTSPDKVIRSTDYGQTWSTILSLNFSNYGQPLEMDQNNPSTFYFTPDGGGFYKSTNSGATFTEISNNYPFRSPCDIMVMWDSSNVIFVADGVTGSGQADIFKSTNGGVNWTKVHTVASSEVPSMCNTVFEKNKMYATEWSGSTIYKSTNFGTNWTVSHNNNGSGWGSDVCREDPTVILTGSYGSNAWLSYNNGSSFSSIAAGLSGAGAGIIVPERGYMLNMQTGNLFKLNINYSVITDVNQNVLSSEIPSGYNLYQNYPNPFNPSTTIRFDITHAGNVMLKVYDQLGKEVSTLVNEQKNPGTYEVSFDASKFASGIYFYKIFTNEFTATKKMLLVK